LIIDEDADRPFVFADAIDDVAANAKLGTE
jgi:hypothetical protein